MVSKERQREICKDYRERHKNEPEYIARKAEEGRKHRAKHKDKIKVRKKVEYEQNKETINSKRRENHAMNREEDNAKRREQKNTPGEKIKTKEYNKTPKRRYTKIKNRSTRPRYGNKPKEMNITIDQYTDLLLQPCYYCKNQIGNLQEETGIGLDRINNENGYIISNVLPCCGFCNGVRSNRLTVEETKIAIEAIIDLRKHNRKIIELLFS